MGNLLIDIGGDVTSYAIILDGKMIHAGGFIMAGKHITKDISTILGVSTEYAEKIKNLNSTLILSQSAKKEIIKYRISSNDETSMLKMTKGDLREIIECRLEEIFETVKSSISTAQIPDFIYSNVILTGGTSNIIGIDQLASRLLSKNSRISHPLELPHISNIEDINKPEFSASIGMLLFLKNLIMKDKIKNGFEHRESSWLKKVIDKIIDY
jgi:cell division protein FtsA